MAFCPVNVPLLLPPVLRMVEIRSFLGPSQKDDDNPKEDAEKLIDMANRSIINDDYI